MDQVGNVEVKGSALPQTGWAESYFILMGRRTEVGYTSRRACGFSGGKVGRSTSLVIFSPQGCAGRLVRGGTGAAWTVARKQLEREGEGLPCSSGSRETAASQTL